MVLSPSKPPFAAASPGQDAPPEQELHPFLHLKLNIDGVVWLHQGPEEKIRLRGDITTLKTIRVVVSGATLFVFGGTGTQANAGVALQVEVFYRHLDSISSLGKARVVSGKPLHSVRPLEVKLHEGGQLELQLQAPRLRLVSASAKPITLRGALPAGGHYAAGLRNASRAPAANPTGEALQSRWCLGGNHLSTTVARAAAGAGDGALLRPVVARSAILLSRQLYLPTIAPTSPLSAG